MAGQSFSHAAFQTDTPEIALSGEDDSVTMNRGVTIVAIDMRLVFSRRDRRDEPRKEKRHSESAWSEHGREGSKKALVSNSYAVQVTITQLRALTGSQFLLTILARTGEQFLCRPVNVVADSR